MKSYRNAAAALLLVLALSSPAFAGVMQTGLTDPDPQPTPTTANSTAQTTTTDGEIHTDVATSMAQVALSVLAVLPSLP
jgi:hypothetical protein